MDFDALAQEVILEFTHLSPRENWRRTNEYSHGEAKMLRFLHQVRDGFTAGELSERMGVSTARIAMILNSLEKKDLIHRAGDAQDRRKVVVLLTERGRILGREKHEKLLRYTSKFLQRLGEQDALELTRLIRRSIAIIREMDCGE